MRRSIYSEFGIRVVGLVMVAEGLAKLFVGHRAPSLCLAFAVWGAQRAGRRKLAKDVLDKL